jgi:hypothetical protein
MLKFLCLLQQQIFPYASYIFLKKSACTALLILLMAFIIKHFFIQILPRKWLTILSYSIRPSLLRVSGG